MNPREQPDEVVLMAVLKRKNRVDQIMANACFTLLNFQPLGKKGFERIHRRAVRHIARRREAEHVVAEQPRSEEHTSELTSLMRTSYAVFCLKKTNKRK